MKTTKLSLFASIAALLFAACASEEKEPVTDTFSDLASADGTVDDKSDKFTGRMTMVGSLEYGQSRSVRHQAGKWSALRFLGNAGDKVVIDVSSANGDTVAWLVDKSMEILAFNDDHGTGTNSRIEHTLTSGASTTFYIVVREYRRRAMTFTVALANARPAGSCSDDSVCAGDQFCGWNGVACIRAPCDVAFDVCQPRHPVGGSCSRDRECSAGLSCDLDTGRCVAGAPIGAACRDTADCSNGFCGCADSSCSTSVCKAYAAEGQSCGGFRPANLVSHCTPAFQCVAPYDIIADIPGHCGAFTTVAAVSANPAAFDGRFIAIKGLVDSSLAACTKIACSPANPCCNACSAAQRLYDDASQVGTEGLTLSEGGTALGCNGNSCTYQDHCAITNGNTWVAGWLHLDGGITPRLDIVARYSY